MIVVKPAINMNARNAHPRFGADDSGLKAVGQSRHYQPWATVVKPNGDIVEIISISAYDKNQNAQVLNTTVIPVGEKTKNRVIGALLATTLCLGVGGFLLPTLFFAAAVCGVTAVALMLSKGLNSSRDRKAEIQETSPT